MTYFKDFSDYTYFPNEFRPGTKNIGWLSSNRFTTESPDRYLLDRLWDFCSIAVAISGGFHFCELCERQLYGVAEKSGVRLKLGHAEIRVFSDNGEIYAAPNLIYHYVQKHHYKLPNKFKIAVMHSPKPPDEAYFERLNGLNLKWAKTFVLEPGESDQPEYLGKTVFSVLDYQRELENRYNCHARFVESVNVTPQFSQPFFVHIFDLIDNPIAKRAYMMRFLTSENNVPFFIALHIPPILSAEAAFQAALQKFDRLFENKSE